MSAQTKSNSPPSRLPDPTDNPEKDIVIWDGKCNFCLKQVQRLRTFAGPHRLAYLSLHDPRVSELCPNLSFDQLMEQMWVLTLNGEQYGGADAGRYLSRKLPLLWWLAPLLHIPFSMPLWRWLYRIIANRRYAIAGKNCDEAGTCHLHQR